MAHILLIEDYPSLQTIYKETLEAENHTVYLAADGDEGLKIANTKQVDIILLDLLLKQTWGLDFLEKYGMANKPATRVIIMSNLFSQELLNKALALGASHYLIKSDVTPKQLAKIINETLEELKKDMAKN